MGAARLAERHLLGKPRGLAGREAEDHAALLAHVERGAGLEIHAAAEGIDRAVGRLALGELERFEHVAGEGGHARVAVLRAEGGHAAAVDRDRGHAGAHAAHADLLDDFVAGIGKCHAGQTDRELGRVHVGQIGEGVHRRDVLEIVGVALLRHRGGEAFLLTGDLKGIEHHDLAAHREIAHCGVARRDRQGGPLRV